MNLPSFGPLEWLFWAKVCARDQALLAARYLTPVVPETLEVFWPCCWSEPGHFPREVHEDSCLDGLLCELFYGVAVPALNAGSTGLDILLGPWTATLSFSLFKVLLRLH